MMYYLRVAEPDHVMELVYPVSLVALRHKDADVVSCRSRARHCQKTLLTTNLLV